MTTDPFHAYARLDPVRDVRPDWDQIGPLVVDAIDEGTRPMTIQMTPPDTEPSEDDRDRPASGRRLLLVAAAAALIAVAIAGIALVAADRAEPPADDPALPTRTLSEIERPYAAHWTMAVEGDFAPGTVDLTLHADGTFETTSFKDVCAMRGTWGIDGTFTAQGECDGVTFTLTSLSRPESISGAVETSDGRSGAFEARYRAATSDRALTDEELMYVGTWNSNPSNSTSSASTTKTLNDDGTFVITGDPSNSFFDSTMRGHWEITEAGMFSSIGTSEGFRIRQFAPANGPDQPLEGRWTSSSGNSRFAGTFVSEKAD